MYITIHGFKKVKLIISFAYKDTQNVPPRCARLQDVIA